MEVQVEGISVISTKNAKFQKNDELPEDSPIYTIGFRNQQQLVGKTVRVTVEVVG